MRLCFNKKKSFLNWLYTRLIDIKVKLIGMGQVLHICNLCSDYICKCNSLDILDCLLNRSINRQNLIRIDHHSSEMKTNITLAEVLTMLETSDARYSSTDLYEKIFG